MKKINSPSIWSTERISPGKPKVDDDQAVHRTKHEQDYDRILFSTSVRRLSDKTQVFPLDTNDSVRTRLTHSHEVGNLARSIGLRAVAESASAFDGMDVHRTVLPMLGAAGLAHDLGNPPFGHQGEAAIGAWFDSKKAWIFDRAREKGTEPIDPVEKEYRGEFLAFDGNPQSLRLLTKLHASQGKVGLDLTASTIMATLKYPVSAANVDPKRPAKKKFGYFCSEEEIVQWARKETGLSEGQRHPVAWITEAADDTAYSVLDVEDSMKKGIISPDDLINILKNDNISRKSPAYSKLKLAFNKADKLDREPSIIRDIKIGYARSFLIEDLIIHATSQFVQNRNAIFDYSHASALMDSSALCNALKNVAKQYAFGNPEVLYIEARGRAAIAGLLDHLWSAIVDRKKPEIDSRRNSAMSKYVYSLISPNYIEAALAGACGHSIGNRLRYRELRLLTDMVAGMTDQFTMNLHSKIESLI